MKIILDRDCTTARLDGRVSLAAYEAIDRATSYFDKSAYRDLEFIHKRWDGKFYFYDQERATFPQGLTSRVTHALNACGIEPEIIDERPLPPWGHEIPEPPQIYEPVSRSLNSLIDLFPDQQEAFRAFVKNPSGCVAHPTGAGKTALAAAIFKRCRDSRCLFIVDRITLLDGVHKELEARLGVRVGRLGGGHHEHTRYNVVVATVQTLHMKLHQYAREYFPDIKIVVYDEAHDISQNMGHQVLMRIPARVRLGLSGTIREASRRMVVEAYLGPIIFEGDVVELIEAGRLARPRFWMLGIGGVIDDSTELEDAYWKMIVMNDTRNRHICDAARRFVARGARPLVLVQRVPHGYEIANKLTGLRVDFVHWKTPRDIRTARIADLEAGRLDVLIASKIFDKGIDLPNVRGLILAGGGRAPALTLQRIGRGMRAKRDGGENVVDVLDFIDHSHRTLRNQSRDRRKTIEKKYETRARMISTLDEMFKPQRERA